MATDAISTFSGMMQKLEEHADAVRTGELAVAESRELRGIRSLELRLAELQLQYFRMARGKGMALLYSGNGG